MGDVLFHAVIGALLDDGRAPISRYKGPYYNVKGLRENVKNSAPNLTHIHDMISETFLRKKRNCNREEGRLWIINSHVQK